MSTSLGMYFSRTDYMLALPMLMLAMFALGILLSVPPARLAGSLGLLSNTWTHILSATEWRSDLPRRGN